MRSPGRVVSLLALVIFLSPLASVAQDLCNNQFVVSEVGIPAKTRLSPSEQTAIKAQLMGRCVDDRHLNELSGEIRDTLQGWGYLLAAVADSTIAPFNANQEPQPIALNLSFDEGPRYKVQEIDIVGNEALSAEQIRSVFRIHLDDFLNMGKVRETANAIRRLYGANGFSQVSVVPQITVLGRIRVCVAFEIIEKPDST
jgi:hemolysin activation/secretion protein